MPFTATTPKEETFYAFNEVTVLHWGPALGVSRGHGPNGHPWLTSIHDARVPQKRRVPRKRWGPMHISFRNNTEEPALLNQGVSGVTSLGMGG